MKKSAFNYGIFVLVSLFVLFIGTTANAQEFRGAISGTITDPNGAAVAGATVEIKNIETNITTNVVTGEDGSYTFPLLQPGKYTLKVIRDGFNTELREGIEVRVADKLTLNVGMTIGMTATVTVQGSALTLETGTVNTGSVIDNKQISELPLIDGAAYQLVTLAPGVSYTGNPAFTGPTLVKRNANVIIEIRIFDEKYYKPEIQ